MRIAITGGTGFIGFHLARTLTDEDHQLVLISRSGDEPRLEVGDPTNARFVAASVTEKAPLMEAFSGCDAVAHLAGINFEQGAQTYESVHVQGTKNVVDAARDAGVSKIVLTSFLRARPACGSAYHESKWAAEEIVRQSGLDYTVFKPGVTYGRGDQMLNHVSRALSTVPVFGLIGFEERRVKPLAIEDLVECMVASLTERRLSETTVPVLGPEELTLKETVRRIGEVIDRSPLMVPVPVRIHYGLAWMQEKTMQTPITSMAQVRMLAEGVTEPAPLEVCEPLPADLQPDQPFSKERIEQGLSDIRRYGVSDLRR